MANKAINRAFLKDALQSYNERIDDAVVGAQPTDIIGEDNAETGAKKGIQTLTVVDNSDTTIAAADREKLLTIVPAINELDRELGDADLTVVDNHDAAVAAEDRPILGTVSEAVNELDRKQGDADLTVVDTTADPAETVAKDNISDAVNVLDKEMGDAATITVVDTTAENPETEAKKVVVESINVLDKEIGDMATSTVVDTLAADYDPENPVTKKVAIEAINVLDKEMGDAKLTVIDTTADPAKTEAETEARTAINVLDKEMGDMATSTVVDTLDEDYDPENPVTKKVAVEAINTLDKEMGDMRLVSHRRSSYDTPKKIDDVEPDAAHYFEYIFNRLNFIPFTGWPDGGPQHGVSNHYDSWEDFMTYVGSSSQCHPYYGDHFWAYIEDTGSLWMTTGHNGCQYDSIVIQGARKMGRLELLKPWKKDTIVDAINSAFAQSAVSIEDTPLDPTDPDYAKIAHRYVFKQNYPEGTDPTVPTTVIGTIDIEKPKFVKAVTTFKADGTEIDPQTGLPLIEGHFYMKLEIENQEDPIYIDLNQLITDFVVEDTDHIDMTLEEKEVAGEKMRVVSADIVPNSLGHTEFVMSTNRELDFVGYDHDSGDGAPEHFELCAAGTPGALTVVTGAPQENEVSLERVETINKLAGFGQKIIVGDTVLHKDAVEPGTKQLDTEAQTLREGVNELVAKDLRPFWGWDETPEEKRHPDGIYETLADFEEVRGADNDPHVFRMGDHYYALIKESGELKISRPNGVYVLWESVYPNCIGDLTDLTTTAKDLLVNAINELDAKQGDEVLTTTAQTISGAINELDAKQGNDSLTTTAQDLSAAVNELNTTKTVTVTPTAEPLPAGVSKSYDINQMKADGTVDKKGTIQIPYSNYTAAADPVTVQVTVDNADDKRTIGAEVIDASLGKTKLDADVNAILDAVPTKLHIISATTYEDFVANILPDANVPANSAVILTNKFKIGESTYMAGTWAYKAISADGTVTWQYMNNGGEMETIIIDLGTNPLPQPTTPEEIAAIKTNAIYVTEDDHGDKKSYIYLKRSTTVPASNEWLQISAGDKGIEWMGTYNYIATTIIIDPDTGLPTTKVVPWEATPEQLAGMTTWFVTKFGRQPTVNDLVTLTVDEAYYGQYLFKNDTWNEYSSLTKATKAQYGVTVFSTMQDYINGVTNKAIDPWLLKQILDEFKEDAVTMDVLEEKLAEKVDNTYLTSVYYDKTVVDSKLQALQKAYIVHEDPELMTPEKLMKYYGSLLYWKDGDTTKSYIVDSEGNIENLGESGISLDGYVPTTDARYLTLKDIKLVDDYGTSITVQQQLDKKMNVPTGAITTVVENNLTPNHAVISNVNGKIASSEVTSIELQALKGIDVTDLATRNIEQRLQALEAGGGGGTSSVAITNCTVLPTVAPNIYTIYHLTADTSTHKAGYYACYSVDPFYGTPLYVRLDNVGALQEVAGAPATLVTNPNPTTLYKNTVDLSVWMYTAGTWTKVNGGGGGSAVDLYINGVLLEGNKTSEDLKIVKPLTKAQYDALSPTEQLNGTIYLITDDNGGGYVQPGNIIDNLYSTDAQSALSANQGRILNEKVTANTNGLTTLNTQVQQLGTRVQAVENTANTLGTQVTNLTTQVASITDPTIPNGLAQRLAAIEQGQSSIAKLIAGIKSMFIYDATGKILTIDPTKLDNIIW